MKNANEIKPFCYYVTNAEGDAEYNGIPQMSDGRIGVPLYTEPPYSDEVLAQIKANNTKAEWPGQATVERLQARIAELEGRLNTEADVLSAGHRLALELECLLLDTKDLAVVSKWWDSGMDALETWRGLPQENPLYTAPPASSQLLAAVKEVIAAKEEARMGAPEMVAHEVKRDVVSRRLNAWGALHAAAEAITEEEYVALTEEEAQQEERTPGMAPEFGADYGLDQKREAEEQLNAAYRGGAVKAAVLLNDSELDMLWVAQEQKYGQMCDSEDWRIYARTVQEEVLRANGLLPREGENHG